MCHMSTTSLSILDWVRLWLNSIATTVQGRTRTTLRPVVSHMEGSCWSPPVHYTQTFWWQDTPNSPLTANNSDQDEFVKFLRLTPKTLTTFLKGLLTSLPETTHKFRKCSAAEERLAITLRMVCVFGEGAQQTKMLLKKLKYYFLNASVLRFCSVFLQFVLDRREDTAGLKEGLAGLLVWQESSNN